MSHPNFTPLPIIVVLFWHFISLTFLGPRLSSSRRSTNTLYHCAKVANVLLSAITAGMLVVIVFQPRPVVLGSLITCQFLWTFMLAARYVSIKVSTSTYYSNKNIVSSIPALREQFLYTPGSRTRDDTMDCRIYA